MSTQPRNFVLATATNEFSSQTFRKLLYSAKSREELKPAKKYLLSYFARGKRGVFKWDPRNQNFEHYYRRDACDSFIQTDSIIFTNDKGEMIDKFVVRDWFFRDTPFFTLEVNPSQPKIYREVDGGYYINQFHGFLHPNPPPFHEFSKEIRDQVKLILNHMREVLCSSNEMQKYYMMSLVMRIAIGQKMQKTMFLYSGPGTGKTMLTWFLRKMVLGPKITLKKANEGVITGQFNKELEGKCLLVLEEMSNSKSVDWITFANRLKDFIDSDTLWMEEKHKTGYEVANITNLIINSNNSKTIRLDRNDRRYFIPDISEKYVENGTGMDSYYAPLDKAMKNPEVGKAFYSYALEYVRLNPDFNERKIPMTKTKLMMINRDNNIVHEFIKHDYVCRSRDMDIASSYLYNSFKTWHSEQSLSNHKKPPTVQEFTRSLASIGLQAKQKRVGDRKVGKRLQWYSASYQDLYTTFIKKNMIDEAENIDEPEGYEHKENTYTPPAEKLPEEPKDSDCSQPVPEENKIEKIEEAPKVVSKKIPPPLPPKPDHLKLKVEALKSISEPAKLIPEPDPASIPLPESDDEFEEPEPIPEPKPESVELIPEPEIVESAPEPYGIPGPSKTSAQKPEYDPEADELEYKPWLKNSKEDMINELYTSAEKYWVKLEVGDSEDFDWTQLIEEIRDREVHKCLKPVSNKWEALLDSFVQRFKRWVEYNEKLERCISNEDVADFLERYQKKKELEFISPPEGFRTIKIENIPCNSQINERECVLAEGEDGWSDAEDEWYDQLEKA
jgi:hypothetical protein